MLIASLHGELGRLLGKQALLVETPSADMRTAVQAILPGSLDTIQVEKKADGVWLGLHKGRGYVMLVNFDDVFDAIDKILDV